MIEKVNPCHPDKVADRIAGAIVDLAYSKVENPKIAVEVLLGHGVANIIIESSVDISQTETEAIVSRITKREDLKVSLVMVAQDPILAHNQDDEIRCGDNGIFKGVPLTDEERLLSKIAHDIYERYPSDGKYILGNGKLGNLPEGRASPAGRQAGQQHGRDLRQRDSDRRTRCV